MQSRGEKQGRVSKRGERGQTKGAGASLRRGAGEGKERK